MSSWRQIYLSISGGVCIYIFTVYSMYSVTNLEQILEFEPIIDKQHYLRIEKGSSNGINTLTRCFFMLCIIIMVYRLSIVLRAVF